jgi:hypothetical protein
LSFRYGGALQGSVFLYLGVGLPAIAVKPARPALSALPALLPIDQAGNLMIRYGSFGFVTVVTFVRIVTVVPVVTVVPLVRSQNRPNP